MTENRRYYILTEDEPCWMWSRKEDNSFDWNIIGYNSKVVSPRKEITEEDIKKVSDDFAIEFAEWLEKLHWEIYHNNTAKELLEIYKKEKYGN